ncbi:MAG: formate dehydrogenase accessory sulfurtransferase FdhD [Acidobacteriota bacterium]|nr:formate dehydrogenase accessory sulfurtransferase FdhD [Acidobacteriota bacterium]
MPEQPIVSLPITRFDSREPASGQDLVAVEEPLLIRLNGADLATVMRTPGHDAELAAGFLFSEGAIRVRPDVRPVEPGVVDVIGPAGETVAARRFSINSSCGVCGRASIDSLLGRGCARIEPTVTLSSDRIASLPSALREAQRVFDRTGGLHAAGLFDIATAELIELREDVGRHNAVDKLVGSALLGGRLPLGRHALMLSGRVSFELVQKALMAGIPVVAAVGAPSSLAVQTAHRFGMTLVGFLREGRFNVYTGAGRIRSGG